MSSENTKLKIIFDNSQANYLGKYNFQCNIGTYSPGYKKSSTEL